MKFVEWENNLTNIFYEQYDNLLKQGLSFYGFDVNNIDEYKNKLERVYVVNENDGYFTLNPLNSISHFFYNGLYLFSISGKYEDDVYKLELFTDDDMYNKIKKENKNEM